SESRRLLEQLVPWVREKGHVPVVADEDQVSMREAVIVPRERLGREIDMAVVLGGDGTILGASAVVADGGIPVLGINMGHLGFLAAFDPGEAREAIEQAISGQLTTAERMRLGVTHVPADGEPVTRMALNDAVIHQGSMARLVEL